MNKAICSSIIDAIGHAPVVDLSRLTADIDARILAKLEYLNPGGSKKDLIARAIHYNGPRKGASFVPVHCGAIQESLLESELFGHERGAFTGAQQRHHGSVSG